MLSRYTCFLIFGSSRIVNSQLNMDGYARLGDLMGTNGALAIFRRYGRLNIQNLLYLQAELNELEQELKEIAFEDGLPENRETQRYSKEWWRLARGCGQDSLQWRKCLEIRAKLQEYSADLRCNDRTSITNMPVCRQCLDARTGSLYFSTTTRSRH